MPNVIDPTEKPIDNLQLPEPITASDRLQLIYSRPGPYTSVYLATRLLLHGAEGDTIRRWQSLRRDLETQGATPAVLEAIDARLALPAPDDSAAVAVIAASDATTIVDYGQEPPRTDLAVIDTLPYAAPLLEWDQRRVPHLVVTIDDEGAHVATFGPDHYSRLDTIVGTPTEIVPPIAELVEATNCRLIVVAGDPFLTRRVADALLGAVPIGCRVVAEPDADSVDELADATVRHVSDTAARTTVGYLRELRYLAAHHSAVDGTADTIAALRAGRADVLLIHDDPDDQRRIWIGHQPHQVSLERRTDHTSHARLVDATIRAAVATDTMIHIIPTTGEPGPDDNTAALRRQTPRPG
jgi:hypothetical protein